ncbi:MAG: hypothetical protein QM647_08195 [Asticcacaulis sp.]|uniref:hypothetical protein n=1 Tax=Asticcacaulis sp. TaxID=1872648 RepID=UPI0039E4BCA0
MKTIPKINAAYWICLIAASVFGTNTGDYFAEELKLGHLDGLPWLMSALLLIFLVEKRSTKGSPLFFWAVIIVIRTAATNIGDAFGDFNIGFSLSLPITAAIYAACVGLYAYQRNRTAYASGPLNVSPLYWVCMILAGILGTIGGDFASFGLHLMPPGTALLFGFLALGLIVAGYKLWTHALYYWLCLAVVRTAGTGGGDALAHWVGLPQATLLTGCIFIGLIVIFYALSQDNWARGAVNG